MKTTKFYRMISILLALVILTSSFTFNSFAKTADTDTANKSSILDWFWDLFHTTSVSVSGLPEGAVPAVEKISNPFNRKSGGTSVGSFLGFYDIKATDKETGKEIHPNGEFEVRLQGVKLEKDQSVYVIHVLDTEDAIKNTPNVRFIDDAGFVNAFKDQASLTEKTTGRKGSVAVEIIEDVTVDNGDIVFTTKSFSIFAISDNPILTVNFYKGAKSDSNLITSIRVKKADIDFATDNYPFESIVYDPGIDYAPEAHVLFRGWWQNNNYTIADAENALSIADVRDVVKAKLNSGVTNGEEIDFFAMLYVQYVITYFDQVGVVCLGRDYALQRADTAEQQIDYQVTLTYVPYGQFENFEGWKLKSGDKTVVNDQGDGFYDDAKDNLVGIYPGGNDSGPSGTIQTGSINGVDVHDYVYKTPTWTRIQGDIYLQAESPEGNWLVFNENGKGATYVAPQFVKVGDATLDPNSDTNSDYGYPITMQRNGYTFGGWYYSKQVANPEYVEGSDKPQTITVIDETRPFTFGSTINENITLFAKWTPVATAKYTVIIWKQNIKGTGYDFQEVMQFTGNTNTAITIVTAQGTGNDRIARIGNQNYTYNGFHLDHFNESDESVIIAPEGTSVFHVYYNRNEYTLSFQVNGATTYSLTTSDDITPQYALINGEYVRLSRIEIPGEINTPYSGTRYNISTNDNDNNPQKYGVYNREVIPVYYHNGGHWSRKQYHSGIGDQRYTGNRYVVDANGQYGFVNGAMVSINSDGSYTTTIVTGYKWQLDGVDYEGDRYVASTTTGWTTIKEIKALYQQNISNNFPIVGTNGVTYNNGERWDPQSNNVGWNEVMVIIDTMPNGNVNFRLDTANRPLKTMYYYVEALPTDTNTVTHKGTKYVLYTSISARYNGVTEEDYLDLTGFTKHDVTATIGGNTLTLHSVSGLSGQYYIASTTQDQSIYFFYTRDSYKIHYFDGLCVNGNNEPQEESDLGLLKESENIYYESDISQYGPDYYTPTRDNYKFEGWYLDEYCTQPYDFDTMPEGGVVVYAKWIQVQYRVFLHPNVPASDSSLKWGVDEHGNEVNQAMSFRVGLGGTVSVPTGTRDEYNFAGWFTDSSLNKSFIPATVLNETTVTTPYDKTVDMTDTIDKWGVVNDPKYNSDLTGYNGDDRFWITKKLDLYAKWRRKIVGADGIYVKYTTADNDNHVGQFTGTEGATEYCDDILYSDSAFAYGIPACEAPEGLHFKYWVVQQWNASANNGAGGFEDSTIIIYPGERFNTVFEYAQRVDVDPTDPTYNKIGAERYDPTLPEHYYDYYMVIRAEYTPAVPAQTIVTYDPNGGTWASTVTDAEKSFTILVNEEFDILQNPAASPILTYTGYDFLGWSFYNDNDPVKISFKGDGTDPKVSADNLDRPNNNEYSDDNNNVLYAVWEIKKFDIAVDKDVISNVSNDSAMEFAVHYTVDNGEEKTLTVTANDSPLKLIEDVPYNSTVVIWEVLSSTQTAFETDHGSDNKITLTLSDGTKPTNVPYETVKITNKRVLGKIVISKVLSEGTATDEQFMFQLTGGNLTSPLTVVMKAGESVTVAELLPGNYSVKEITGWSWRYTPVGDTSKSVTIVGSETKTAEFTNKRNDKNWLYGENAKDNAYGN